MWRVRLRNAQVRESGEGAMSELRRSLVVDTTSDMTKVDNST